MRNLVSLLDPQCGKPVTPVKHRSITSWTKRMMDLLASVFLLTCLMPVIVVISILVVLDSPGFPVYLQTRVGWRGRRFKMLKFRSMYIDCEGRLGLSSLLASALADGKVMKMKRDPRVTRVGRLIRATSIDELPQLINVLMGRMSLVGPRALIPQMLEPYPEWTAAREVVKPGITGLWQVSAREHNQSLADMIDYDLEYIRNWSIRMDLHILVRTFGAVISRKGAV